HFKGVNTYEDLYHFSINNSDKFWGELAKSRLDWIKPFGKVSDCDMHTAKFRWFEGGKLNVSVNCVDRHAAVHPDRVALIWEKDELGTSEKVTYSQLLIMVCKLANCLKERGIARGDRVAIYMPVSPIAVAAMLACARIGAVHSVVFAGFSAEALAQRIQDGMVETVITTDQGVRGGKVIELKQTVDNAVEKCPSVKRVFIAKRTGEKVSRTDKDIDLDLAMESASSTCPAEVMDSEDLLFMLSSTTFTQPKRPTLKATDSKTSFDIQLNETNNEVLLNLLWDTQVYLHDNKHLIDKIPNNQYNRHNGKDYGQNKKTNELPSYTYTLGN
uniref:acetate--CoA ligase n=1 Tax=Ciona savignyi TaxID=51511 RepID=H2YFH7_CIOSA